MKRSAFGLALLFLLAACPLRRKTDDAADSATAAATADTAAASTATTAPATTTTPTHVPGGPKTTTVVTSLPTPGQAANKAKIEITRSNFRSELQKIEQEKDEAN